MQIQTRLNGPKVLVQLRGEISWQNCEELRESLQEYISDQTEMICLDLRNVSMLDSVATGNLIRQKVSCGEKGIVMPLIEPAASVAESLRAMRLHEIFEMIDPAEAEAFLKKHFSEK